MIRASNILVVCLVSIAIFSKFGVAETGSGVLAKLEELEKKSELLEWRLNNAVVAFDSEQCPKGWRLYTAASGRTIIGSGRGDGLTPKSLGKKGGAETHVLTVAELPSHSHEIQASAHYHVITTDHPRTITKLFHKNEEFQSKGETFSTGEGKPHNNLPPYLVLNFCKRMPDS